MQRTASSHLGARWQRDAMAMPMTIARISFAFISSFLFLGIFFSAAPCAFASSALQ